ncbi:obscurin-like protein [Perilla frutescens var. frutescens]|nr:obscurin-like protein [Perilla frutescens var. frutescens]
MAKQPQYFFLEEWLRSISVISSNKNGSGQSSTSSAQALIQAWADLRDSLQCQAFHARHLQALKILISSQAALHVADPQAKLVISILSSQSLSLPEESYPLFFRLLYIWVRKSRQTSLVVESAIEVLSHIFSSKSCSEKSSLFFSEGVLLLGALSFQTSASEKSKRLCLELLCNLLEEECRSIFLSDELASMVLAGAGYALSSTVTVTSRRTLDILFRIWGQEGGPFGIPQELMLLHLIEWVLSNALNLRSRDIIDVVRELLENVQPTHSSFAVVMTAAGVLRAINRSGSSGFVQLTNSIEDRLEIVARELVSAIKGFDYGKEQPRLNHLLHCVALALARSGSVSYRPSILVTLAMALLTEVFPLQRIYNKILKSPEENWAALFDETKDLLSSFIFKEAGAITAVFCNQYAYANEDSRSSVENLVWDYCQAVYLRHQEATLMLRGRGDQLISDIEKIAESAFLMIVVFALGVTKHRLDTKIDRETHLQISVKILVSFSCMEYFRRMRLPEYMDTIRAVIVSVQENESACVGFVQSMPSYNQLITNKGSSNQPKMEHLWCTNEVQTARIVFYMRVVPTCVDRLPASVFRKAVAPVMFLYMGHPNVKVARYTHSVFVAFVSSGKDLDQDERALLKEQLVFYYVQRSLEGYPGITPFEGMASGVAALVRHLPAGSPSIFYCISSLIQKATSLCNTVNDFDSDLWKNWEGELEPPKKVLDLLSRLLSLVDIQVLPDLMKSLAQLIVQLPLNGQNVLLNQLYHQIAETDDVIRKPALVSWVQSLSYLCSPETDDAIQKLALVSWSVFVLPPFSSYRKRPGLVEETVSAQTTNSVSLNGISSAGTDMSRSAEFNCSFERGDVRVFRMNIEGTVSLVSLQIYQVGLPLLIARLQLLS